MAIYINRPVKIREGVFYTPSSAHRRKGNKDKSWWIISLVDEVQCFDISYRRVWVNDKEGWGLYCKGGALIVVGHAPDGEKVKIAKFLNKNSDQYWHGYPANYKNNPQDRPPMDILFMWRDEKLIKKHHMSHIRRGKECNL
jgi:hypothetical protein